MTDQLAKQSAYLDRLNKLFTFFSVLSGIGFAIAFLVAVAVLISRYSGLIFAEDPVSQDWWDNLHLYWLTAGSLIFILAGLTWLFWVFSSGRFARAVGAQDMRHAPWKAVIWNFIPIMHYGMPLLALVEIEAATKNPANWRDERPSKLVGAFWVAAKISAILSAATDKLIGEDFSLFDKSNELLILDNTWLTLVMIALILANRFMRYMGRLRSNILGGEPIAAHP
jgi:hypothetical protein